MNSNTSKNNLTEALKKYNLLSEYNFYIPRGDDDKGEGEENIMDEQDLPVEDVAVPETTPETPEVPMDAAPAPADTAPMTPEPTPTPTLGGEVEVDVTDIVKDTKETKGAVTSGQERPVSLRQRAAPFIDMLQRAHKAGKDVVWGT